MKLTKLFASAALSLGLAFSANAELIVQTFDVDVEGTTATLEIAGNTANATDDAGDFLWLGEELDYFSIFGLTLPGMDSQDFTFSGMDLFDAFPFFEAAAYGDSVSGPGEANGFYFIVFELDLSFLDPMYEGAAMVEIFNDDFGADMFVNVFTPEEGEVEYFSLVTPGGVKVSAPATLGFILLSMGALVFARRK